MRRGHKRMELVRFADRGRRRDERPTDEVFMTRRTFVFKGMILAGFTALAGKLWQMQVIEAKTFQGQAAQNITRSEPLKAARGLIVDRNGNLLADNRISWTVSVVPAQLPTDPRQLQTEADQLIKALDLKPMLVVRRNALPLGSQQYVLTELAPLVGMAPKDLINEVLAGDQTDNLVVIKDTLEPADADRLRQAEPRLPGVHVISVVEYAVESAPSSPLPQVIKKDANREVALMLEANRLYLPGVQVSDETLVRQYSAGPDFSHILGYVGPINQEEYDAAKTPSGGHIYEPDDDVGRGGLEEALEADLRGTRGIKWVRTDAQGVEVSEIVDRRVDPVPGDTAVLTVDRDFQKAVTAALQDGINAANQGTQKAGIGSVGAGVAIALDPRNGEILALVNIPTFDNQIFVDGINQQQYEALLNDPYKPLTNMAVSGAFPPGSTIKPLLACAGLQEGNLTLGTEYTCRGMIRVPNAGDESSGNYYYCWNHFGHGTLAVEDAIAASCDVFFYNVSAPGQTLLGTTEKLHYYIPGDPTPHNFEGIGIDKVHQYLTQQFGWGSPTGIELAGEAPGLVPTQKWLYQTLRGIWSVGDTINVSIGQGYLSCTPLQLACATAAIANGGTFYRPHLVRELRDAGGKTIKTFAPEGRTLGIDKTHIETVRQGMRLTVASPAYGSAYGKFLKTGNDFPIAGKTGTAEYGVAVNGKYARSHAWFTSFAPFDAPEIVVAVLIEGGGEGSTYAVPVADAVLATHFKKTPQSA